MTTLLEQRTAAVAAFHERCPHLDAERVVASLSDGLKLLCDLFFARVGHDVEEQGQMDSMLLPAGAMAELNIGSSSETAWGYRWAADCHAATIAAND